MASRRRRWLTLDEALRKMMRDASELPLSPHLRDVVDHLGVETAPLKGELTAASDRSQRVSAFGLELLSEGSLTHNVAQERPGAFILTPRTPSPEDLQTFQRIAQEVDAAERDGLLRHLSHRQAGGDVDLIFVIL